MAFDSVFKNLFMTPSQKKQKTDDYFRKMFPYGEKQKNWEDNIIESIYADNKKLIPTIKYMCYTRREMLIDKTNNDEYFDKKYRKLLKRMKLSQKDIDFIEMFTKLEYEADRFSDLPALKDVMQMCKQLRND